MTDEYESEKYEVEILTDPSTGRLMGERWRDMKGRYSRTGDLPAYVDYCPNSGNPIYQRWYRNGEHHRDDQKPATVANSADASIILAEHYAVAGGFHREGDKPAVIFRDQAGRVTERQFWRGGQLHRVSGPAIECFDTSTGRPTKQENWVNGERQQTIPAPETPSP